LILNQRPIHGITSAFGHPSKSLFDFFAPPRGLHTYGWRGRFKKLESLILNQDFPLINEGHQYREAARSLQRYGGALPSDFAIAELHHYTGRDPLDGTGVNRGAAEEANEPAFAG
jgi:hypothetical protein